MCGKYFSQFFLAFDFIYSIFEILKFYVVTYISTFPFMTFELQAVLQESHTS